MNHQIASDAVIQNLKDAGCEDTFIERFILALRKITKTKKKYFYCFVDGGTACLMKYTTISTSWIVSTI